MPTKTRAAFNRELEHHPFELVGAKVEWEHHYQYVKRMLLAKIDRQEFS